MTSTASLTTTSHVRTALAVVGILAQWLAGSAGADPGPMLKVPWLVDGVVQTAARQGNTLYVGGRFTHVAPTANALGSLFHLSPGTGAPAAPAMPLIGGSVHAIEPDGSGGYYAGGVFSTVGGAAQANLTHVLADGTRDAAFMPAIPGRVVSLTTSAGALFVVYVSGQDSRQAGVPPVTTLVKLSQATGAALPWVPAVNPPGQVTSVDALGTVLVVRSAAATLQPVGVLAFDAGTGTLTWQRELAAGNGPSDGALLVAGARVFVSARDGLRALTLSTGQDDATPLLSTVPVTALALSGTTLYLAHAFTGATVLGQPRGILAAVDINTPAVLAWQPPDPDGRVSALSVSAGGSVFAGGVFANVGASPRRGLAQFDAIGSLLAWTADAYPTGTYALASHPGGGMLVGATLAASGNIARTNLAAFDLVTGALLAWAPAGRGPVTRLAVVGGTVVANGSFTPASPARASYGFDAFEAFEATTGAAIPWAPDPAAEYLVAADGAFVYVATRSQRVTDPVTLGRLAAATGAPDRSWVHVVERDPLNTLDAAFVAQPGVIADGALLVGICVMRPNPPGPFLTECEARVRRLDLLTARATDLPVLARPGAVPLVAVAGDTVYMTDGTRLEARDVRRDPGGAVPSLPLPTPSALAAGDGRLFAAGTFTTIAGLSRRGFVELTPDGVVTDWNPAFDYADDPIVSGAVSPYVGTFADVLVLGGAFSAVVPEPLRGLAVYDLTGARGPANLRARPNGPITTVTWDAATVAPANGYVIEAGGAPWRVDGALPVGAATSFSVDVPAGTYWVRVRSAGAAGGTERVSNEIVLRGGCTAAPLPPTSLAAGVTGANLTLSWMAPDALVTRYTLLAGTGPGLSNIAAVALPGTPTAIAGAVSAGTYFARVTASNACGTSGPSGEVFFTIGAVAALPAAPTNLTSSVTGSTLTLSWTAPAGPVTGYVLEAGSALGLANIGAATIGAGTSFVIPGVPAGVYYVRVRAVTSAGSGAPSSDVVVVVP